MNKKTPYIHSVKLREKTLQSGNKSLYLDIYLGKNKRYYEFLGIYYNPKNIADKRQKKHIAEELRVKKELEIISNDYGIIPAHNKRINFVDYFNKLVNEKPKTEKAWKNTLIYLKNFTNNHIKFNAINDLWLEDFKSYLLTQVSSNTAHTYFSKIKAALNLAFKNKITNTNYGLSVKQIPKKDVNRSYLTKEELITLSKTFCSDNQVKNAFIFACNTGLRISDIKGITFNDILLDERKIIIQQKKTKEMIYLPLNKVAIEIIEIQKKQKITNMDNKIFNLPSEGYIRKVIKKWVEVSNIKKNVSFHTSRHTFATISLNMGVDLYTVSKLLGHKNITNTQIYAKIIDKSMENAVSKLDEIEVSL